VTIHVPLTPQTKHMLNPARLGAWMRFRFFINDARGGLIEA